MPIYRICLALHVIAVISWMAGLLYLFRLFVYHVEETEPLVKSRLVVWQEKLSRIIVGPAAMAALLFGVGMLGMNPSLLDLPWMRLKILLVAGMLAVTHFASKLRRQLARGECPYSSRTLRFLNEVPTLLMIGIVFLVILKAP